MRTFKDSLTVLFLCLIVFSVAYTFGKLTSDYTDYSGGLYVSASTGGQSWDMN